MKEEYTFCPLCAEPLEHAREGKHLRMACRACGWIHYRNPAPAAGVVIVENGAVLLVKRRYEPFEGLWSIPSGFVEIDEDVRATAVREALEETGLAVEIDSLLAVETCFDDPRGNTLLVLYRARRTGGTPTAGDDAEDVGFFPLTGLPPLAFEAHRKVLGELTSRRGC
jgi:ADP-ribose pyrophosphatase YjhB (NUDIX family)